MRLVPSSPPMARFSQVTSSWRVSRSGGAPGTPSAWVTPPPAPLPRRLIVNGGFTVDGGRHRHLDQQARRLGFADLRACLQALLADGWSIPQLADQLATTHAAIRHAIQDCHVRQPPRRQQLARHRQRTAQQRAAAQVAGLGFGSVRAYLLDRLVTQAWTLTQVTAELGAAPATHTASAGSLPGWAGGADP